MWNMETPRITVTIFLKFVLKSLPEKENFYFQRKKSIDEIKWNTGKTPNSPERSQKRRREDRRMDMTEKINVNFPMSHVKNYIKCKWTEY